MARIATLTLNPTIDGSSDAATVQPTHKIRTVNERFDPGGGGINVARVLARLGADVEAVYLAGGVTGPVLGGLLDRAGLPHRVVPIAGDTRISLAVHEVQSGKEYRFVPQGPLVSEAEAAACLALVSQLDCQWLVLSGSLPRGLPDDFYARIVATARARGMAVVLDTSGAALKATLAAGGLRLAKPSLGELEAFAGRKLDSEAEIAAAAGAILVEAAGSLTLPAIPAEARSAVGAGDSFVAGMTHALAAGWDSHRAFRLGIAAGTAAVLTPGTDLCHRADIARMAAILGIAALP